MIWASGNPEIATVDKFGVLHAHQAGEVIINTYSWDDANPSAKNEGETYSTSGIKGEVRIVIAE
ncbi:hypothetical protein [Pontiella desulfatans]|uniref:hypothetical protein n=1 Tax=Pontiella desulfatans TaxID=2750659 RepID=UPI001443C8AE|nr:hypothetical protein [Pontiella desulfatans]